MVKLTLGADNVAQVPGFGYSKSCVRERAVTKYDCGREAQRVFGASGIAFKGTGFYNTDQRGHSSHSCGSCSGGSCSSCSR